MKLLSALIAFTLLASVVVLSTLPLPALAQAKPKLTVAQGLSLLAGLKNLDGHVVIVKQGGVETPVLVPWEFGSGSLRLKISGNISILAVTEKAHNDARQAMIKEVLKASGKSTLEPGSEDEREAQRQYDEILAGPVQGSDDLARIKASELKLDKNEISVTALSALGPILDMDVK